MLRKFTKLLRSEVALAPFPEKRVELTQVSQKAPNEIILRWNGGFSTSLSRHKAGSDCKLPRRHYGRGLAACRISHEQQMRHRGLDEEKTTNARLSLPGVT
jgi:IS5 family transposase